MVKLTFKNVGQGDSIILEWNSNGSEKIALIDCNLYTLSNPALDHVKAYVKRTGNSEIEFCILSHPHTDHFSGFVELLEHCRESGVVIKRFLHTSMVTPDYLKSATRSIEAEEELFKLFSLLKDMRNNGLLDLYAIDDNPDVIIPLATGYSMQVLSPSSIETDKYIKGVKFPFDEEESTSNPNANWLSTVLKIYNDQAYLLLTSDAESTVLTRIGKNKTGRISNGRLAMTQVPHHGSRLNLNKTFWRMRSRTHVTPTIISVGKNGYGHPSGEVISFFDNITNYAIKSTEKKAPVVEEVQLKSSMMDMISQEADDSEVDQNKGDVVLIFDGEVCTIQN
jgi:competence protein ComEC